MDNLRSIIVLSLILILTRDCTSDQNECPVLSHSKSISINNVLGTWYAIRGIEHTNLETGQIKGSKYDCRSLTFTQNELNDMVLQWNGTNKIIFKRNINNPNLWQTGKAGTTINTLQVTELDDSYIIITVCSTLKRVSSAVLHKEPTFSQQQAQNAITILENQNLRTLDTFDRCQKREK